MHTDFPAASPEVNTACRRCSVSVRWERKVMGSAPGKRGGASQSLSHSRAVMLSLVPEFWDLHVFLLLGCCLTLL